MDTVIKIIGIVFVCAGIVYLLKPNVIKSLMEFFKKGKRIYLAALIRLALAVVFFSSYRDCDQRRIIFVFGILFLFGGLLIFILGSEKIRAIIDWWQRQPVLLLRVIALIFLAIGAIIVYSA
jgi:uncharacterized protein YjeT (DUF2065 family)